MGSLWEVCEQVEQLTISDNLAIWGLQFLGRWTSSNTMQFYLQEAFSMHVESSLNDTSVRMLETLHMFTSLLDTPPFSPCNSLVR